MNIPQVLDPVIRSLRTVVQVLVGFVAVAPLVPLIVQAIGAPDGSRAAVVLAAIAGAVATAAGIVARIMAIPGVNALLGRIGLAGHAGQYQAGADTYTQLFAAVPPAAVDPLR